MTLALASLAAAQGDLAGALSMLDELGDRGTLPASVEERRKEWAQQARADQSSSRRKARRRAGVPPLYG